MYEQQQQQQNYIQQNQPLPEYIQVQGKNIFVGGLDYNALNQQKRKQQSSKNSFLSKLQNKINIISGNVLERIQKRQHKQQQEKQLDQMSLKILQIYKKQEKNQNQNTSIYYEFDTNFEGFGKRKPQIIKKRMGKAYNKPIYINLKNQLICQFSRLLTLKNNQYSDQQIDVQNKDLIQQNQDDSDDIFAQKKDKKIDISIGKKLDFQIDEDDIFATTKRQKPVERQQQNLGQDKYFFMRRKKQKNNIQLDDGYGQCYAQTGPSLKQMIQMKKQGIQLFGDLKQMKTKQKNKPNLSKQYQKVKKIIDKKYK